MLMIIETWQLDDDNSKALDVIHLEVATLSNANEQIQIVDKINFNDTQQDFNCSMNSIVLFHPGFCQVRSLSSSRNAQAHVINLKRT